MGAIINGQLSGLIKDTGEWNMSLGTIHWKVPVSELVF